MKNMYAKLSIFLVVLFSLEFFTNIALKETSIKKVSAAVVDIYNPTAPTNLRSGFMIGDKAILFWDKSTDDGKISKYEVYCGDKLIGTTTKTDYEISGLLYDAEHVYKVRAMDSTGKYSNFSDTIKIVKSTSEVQTQNNQVLQVLNDGIQQLIETNSNSDQISQPNVVNLQSNGEMVSENITIPNTPKNLISTNQTDNTITLQWECDAGQNSIKDFYIYNGDSKIASSNGKNSVVLTKLKPSTVYSLSVRSVDSLGYISDLSSTLIVRTKEDTEAPTKPTNVVLVNKNETSANITWDESLDNNGIQSYEIFCNDVKIGEARNGQLNYDITGLTANTTYKITVKSKDLSGNLSESSGVLEVTTCKEIRPTATTTPTEVATSTKVGEGANKSKLQTTTATTTPTSVATSTPSSNSTASTSNTKSTATKGSIQIDDTCQDTVVLGSDGSSTNDSKVSTIKLQLTENTMDKIVISWTASSNPDVPYYNIYKDGMLIKVVNTSNLSYTDLVTDYNNQYVYSIAGRDSGGVILDESNQLVVQRVKDTIAPKQVSGLSKSSIDNNNVAITWRPSSDNKSVVGYNIYLNGNTVPCGYTSETSYNITGLQPNSKYVVTVKAKDYDGNESVESNLTVLTPWILTADEVVNGDFTVDTGANVVLNGHILTINGSLYCKTFNSNLHIGSGGLIVKDNYAAQDTSLDLEQGQIFVGGNFEFNGCSLFINEAYLIVNGNLDINNPYWGCMGMTKASSYVYVGGSLKCVGQENKSKFSNGTLDVKGNISFNYWSDLKGEGDFVAILDGDSFQTITNAYFSTLIINKGIDRGYKFKSSGYKNLIYMDVDPIETNFAATDGTYGPTGNYSKQYTDLELHDNGTNIQFARTYNSLNESADSGFGKGWTFNYESKVAEYNDAGYVSIKLPDGSSQSFRKNSDGTFTSLNSRNTLKKDSSTGFYSLTTKEQTVYVFNSSLYLWKVIDRYGNVTEITVNSNGRVTSIKDSAGRTYNITYDVDGKFIQSITDPMGNTVSYGYTNGLLTSVTDQLKNTTNYSYTDGLLSTITNSKGEVLQGITYYPSFGRDKNKVHTITDENENTKTYTYNNSSMVTTIKDSDGNVTEMSYDRNFNVLSTTYYKDGTTDKYSTITTYFPETNNQYNYSEVQTTQDINGNVTTYTRDGNGNTLTITYPDGSVKTMTYYDNNNLKTETYAGVTTYYIYDPTGVYLLKKVQPIDGVLEYTETADQSKFSITTYDYYYTEYVVKGLLKSVTDPNGNKISYTYYSNGNIYTQTDGEGYTTTYVYNENGWKKYEISPLGNKTEYVYDAKGNVIKTILTTFDNQTTTVRHVFDTEGNLTKEISENLYDAKYDTGTDYTGTCSKVFTYYKNGKVKTETVTAESTITYTTTYTYDINGNVQTKTCPNGSIYTYEYDILNRLLNTYFQESSSAAKVKLESQIYELADNKCSKVTDRKYINNDGSQYIDTITIYDYAGRKVKVINAENKTEETIYNTDGTIDSFKDNAGSYTYYQYNQLRTECEEWKPVCLSDKGDILYSYTKNIYDYAGNITEQIQCKDLVLKYQIPTINLITKTYTYYKNYRLKSESSSYGYDKQYIYLEKGSVIKTQTKVDASSNDYIVLEKGSVIETQTKVDASSNDYIVVDYIYDGLGNLVNEVRHAVAGELADYDLSNTTKIDYKTQYIYDKEHNVTDIIYPDYSKTHFDYDYLDRLTKTTKSVSNVTVVATKDYNWEGKILKEVDGNGVTTDYIYYPIGFLKTVTVTSKDGKNKSTAYYEYDLLGRKTVEIAPNDYDASKKTEQMNRTEYIYYNTNRVKSIKSIYFDTVNKIWKTIVSASYIYDNNGNIKEIDTPDGANIHYAYNFANKLSIYCDQVNYNLKIYYTNKYIYDGLLRLSTDTNAEGFQTKYTYDDAGNLINTYVMKLSTKVGSNISSSTYNLIGEKVTSKDGNGVTTTYLYNSFGKVKKVTYVGDYSIESYYINYQYNLLGRLVKSIDRLGKLIIYTYDSVGKVLTQTESKLNGSEAITTGTTYDNVGNQLTATDGNGSVITYTYNYLNKVETKTIYVTDANGNKVKHQTTYQYDKNGNLKTETDWLGNTITYIYDPLNRLWKKQDQNGKTIEILEYYDGGNLKSSTDALGNKTSYQYDKANRLTTTTDAELHTEVRTYDKVGNLKTLTDGNNHTTTYGYDGLNRLTTVTVDDNGITEITSYTYDGNGNMKTQKDADGSVMSYDYNVANKLKKTTYPTGTVKVVNNTYYGNGLLKTSVDRNGNTTTYTYDVHGRVKTQVTISADGKQTVTINYTYDNNGNQLTITDATGTTTRTYNELNEVTSKTVQYIGKTKYQYDVTTGITNLQSGYYAEVTIDPKGNTVVKVYDKTKRLVEVRDGSNVTKYTYYDNGNLKSVTLPNGFTEEYTFNKDNTLYTLVNKDSSGKVIEQFTYGYDKAKNIISKTDSKGTTSYLYDTLNRIWVVTEPTKTTTYTYDKSGNRDTETIVQNGVTTLRKYNYDDNNELTSINESVGGVATSTTNYTYDNNGNMLTSTVGTATTIYTYDLLNEMITSTTADGLLIKYAYNGEGLRVAKTSNGKKVRYLYEGNDVILEVDGSGNQTARSVNGLNLISRIIGTNVLYYMYNGHQDVTKLVNAAGKIVASYYYDAFGEILESNESVDNPIRYAGYQYDKETGLYYLNARMYDPTIARFLQEDTYTGKINNVLTLNRYTYCQNNPITGYDPTGHFLDKIWDGIKKGASSVWGGVKKVAKTVQSAYKSIDKDVENSDKTYEDLNIELGIKSKVVKRVEGVFNGIGKFGWGAVKGTVFAAKSVIDWAAVDCAAALNAAGVVSDKALYKLNDKSQKDFKTWEQLPGNIIGGVKNIVKNTPRFFTDSNMSIADVSNLTSDVLNTAFIAKGAKDFVSGKITSSTKEVVKRSGNINMTGDAYPAINYEAGNIYGGLVDYSKALDIKGGAKAAESTPTKTLYHYTNEEGLNGILESNELRPSLKANNPKDARYGNGQYLSDIVPETTKPTSLASKFIRVPNKYKYTNFVEIDVTGLEVVEGRSGVYVIPNEGNLDITGRIVRSGKVGK